MRDTYFSYEMHVKGSKENVQKFLESYNVSEDDIIYNEEFAEECIVHFCGDGDYTLDHGCLSDYRDYVDAQDKNLSRFSLKLRTMFLSLEAQIQEIHQACDPYRSFHYYDKGKLKIEEYEDVISAIELDKIEFKFDF